MAYGIIKKYPMNYHTLGPSVKDPKGWNTSGIRKMEQWNQTNIVIKYWFSCSVLIHDQYNGINIDFFVCHG